MASNVIFIGGIWLNDEEETIIKNSKGNVQIAANTFQHNIIKGFEGNGKAVTIINEQFVGAFPMVYRKSKIPAYRFKHLKGQNGDDYNVGFINLPIVKHCFRYCNSKKYIRKCCGRDNNDSYCVIGYSMTYSVVKGLLYAKKINPDIQTCLIIPDLPEFMNLGNSRGKIFEILKFFSNKKLYRLIKKIDSYAVLTRYMYERLDSDKPYTVIEGIADDQIKNTIQKSNSCNNKNIVYTGTLEAKYGVCDLVDAFHAIEAEDVRLVICGAGDGESYIKRIAKEDYRIDFKGVVANNEARKLQQSAYLLVNPRNSKEEYTKYSFPSKTMEYMASGRPVLMYKLLGIPDEYDDYLFYVEGSLRETLNDILNLPSEELTRKGNLARDFVLSKKNSSAQIKKLIDLLN